MIQTMKLQAGVGIKELIATLVVSGVLLLVGVIVFATVASTLPTSTLSTSASSTVTNITNTAYSGFQLATVALIVLAASMIIAILVRSFAA